MEIQLEILVIKPKRFIIIKSGACFMYSFRIKYFNEFFQ